MLASSPSPSSSSSSSADDDARDGGTPPSVAPSRAAASSSGRIANDASFAAGGAATVSPFADRVVEPLELVPEEEDGWNLGVLSSQSSSTTDATCRTFRGDDAAHDGDYFSESEFRMLHDDDCPPPTKRARPDDGGRRPLGSDDDEDMSGDRDGARDGHCAADGEKTASADRVDLGNDIDVHDGMDRCHVCSARAPRGGDAGPATATTASPDVRRGGGGVGGAPPGPRCRSLLAYFQPTKRPAASHPLRARGPDHHASSSSHDMRSSNNVQASSDLLPPCRYCDKPTCPACARRCEMCQSRFCIFCTKVNYDSSVVERVLCFECDESWRDDDGCGIFGVGGSGTGGGGRDVEDCDMMDL